MVALSASRPPLRGLISTHKRSQRNDLILSTVTKNVLNIANSADPDEMLRYAASHLGLRYLQMLHFWIFFSIAFIEF